jgi:hypothetical protein
LEKSTSYEAPHYHCVCVIKINSLIGLLFRETTAVYSEDHAIYINSLAGKMLNQLYIQGTVVVQRFKSPKLISFRK